ncbi:MAG: TetR/AcrR family transcriptional regulator [Clostridia bacterium]|nr:TetR/AcrR family transcriptional regulator [Clostridia bacterium]
MKAERQQALLAAARRVFARKGYHGATVRDIAEEAGVATGTFYLYFRNKEASFLALIDEFYRLLIEEIAAARAAVTRRPEKLAVSIAAVLRTFAAHQDLARILLLQAAGSDPAFDARLAAVHEEFARLLRDDLEEGVASRDFLPTDTDLAARAIVGSLHEVITAWLRGSCQLEVGHASDVLTRFNLQAVAGRRWPPGGDGTAPAGEDERPADGTEPTGR